MNFSKPFLGIVLIVLIANETLAQDSLNYSTLSVGVGLNGLSSKDALFADYETTNLLINSNYTRHGLRGSHAFDLTYTGGQAKYFVYSDADYKFLTLKYDYLRYLKSRNSKSKFVASLGFGTHWLLASADYLPNTEYSENRLTSAVYFTFSGNLAYHINSKNKITAQFGIPIAGLVYRPGSIYETNSITKFSPGWDGGLMSVKLEYARRITSNIDLTATYIYNSFKFDEPQPIAVLQQGLLLGVRMRF